MKKLLLIAFILIVQLNNAQNALHQKIASLITVHTGNSAQNKLIAINFFDLENKNSREANKEWEKVYNTFQVAKLKGGSKGVYAVIILAKSKEQSEIVLKKDGVINSVVINNTELNGIDISGIDNIVFDSQGNTVYKNLPTDKIFSSVHQLITR